MTFEEYKKLAENPQFSDAPAIFKVEVYVIDSCGSKKYYRKTMSEPWKYSEIYCLTLEEAKQCLHNEMDRIGFEKYCAYIYQIPINKSTNFPYDRAWLYDHNGNLTNQSYCPYNINEEHFPFRGRPEYAIRFKRGDIVELLNDYCDKSKFAIVYNTPPDIETAYKMNNRLKEYGSLLDSTNDRYFLVYEAKKFASIVEGDPLRLIKPRFEPPRNVVRYLNRCLQKTIKHYICTFNEEFLKHFCFMKRILIFAVILTTLTSCAQNDKNMKTLVTYFSATGNTEAVAKQIADITGADIFEIRPEVPYSQADLDWTDKTSRSSVEMNDRSFRPAFIKDLKNHDDYNVIYIGFPIWWYTAPTIINSFVEEYGFEGKKVVMFATSGGSTPEKALKEFKAAYPEINWVEAKLLNGATEEQLKSWIEEVKK